MQDAPNDTRAPLDILRQLARIKSETDLAAYQGRSPEQTGWKAAFRDLCVVETALRPRLREVQQRILSDYREAAGKIMLHGPGVADGEQRRFLFMGVLGGIVEQLRAVCNGGCTAIRKPGEWNPIDHDTYHRFASSVKCE